LEGKELLLDQQIKELKDTMVQGFSDIKGQIANLTADVKALNAAFNSQDKALAIINTDLKNIKEKVAEIEKQTDNNHDDIIKIQTETAATKKTYNWLISLTGLGITVINVIIRFIDWGR
jgi:septation ring formation regulator EzrA